MTPQFKGPNCKAPSGALGEVLVIRIHHFALFFPKRASHNATASGSTKPGSLPDFSSLLIFNWKEQIPKPIFFTLKKKNSWASLVVQWLRIRLPMQGTWVRALVWEDPTCRGATRPVSHNY